MKTRKYSALLALLVVLVIAMCTVLPLFSVYAMTISVVPQHSVNARFEIRALSYTIPVPRMVVFAVPSIYFADALAETMVVGTFFQIAETLLLTARTAAGVIVASIIVIAATRDIIEQIVSTTRRRLIGHHKGPPHPIVWLFSLVARTLEGMIVYFADILIWHGNMEVDTATTDGKLITDSPFSLGVTNDSNIVV